MSKEDVLKSNINSDLLRPVFKTGIGWYITVAISGSLLLAAMGAFGYQLYSGIGVWGLNRPVMWAFDITNFVFWIGISHAGTLISAILRVTGAEWRRPITRMAEGITVFALIVGAPLVIIDMGRPDRLFYVIIHGRLASPILWDALSVTTYMT